MKINHILKQTCLGLLLVASNTAFAQEHQAQNTEDEDKLIPIGYGIEVRQSELTSAVGFVDAEDLNKSSAVNPANTLYGKIPGLTVLQNGGTSWNSNPNLYIRGVETFDVQNNFTNTNILTIVDGFEQPISSLSMPEIESIVVLKDAAALAIYGMRGANGVMLITTKKGKGEKLSVDVNYEHGITKAFRLPNFLNAHEYAQAVNQAHVNDGLAPLYSQLALDKYRDNSSPYLFPNVDWLNESLNEFGYFDNFSVSFQQQTDLVRQFSMLNFESETGLLKPVNLNDGYNTKLSYYRFNFRTNIDINLTKTTKFAVRLSGNIGQNRRPAIGDSNPSGGDTDINDTDIFEAIYNTPALAFPVKTEDDVWGISSTFQNNPVAIISSTGYANQQTSEIKTIFSLEQQLDMLLKGLAVEGTFSYNKYSQVIDQYSQTYRSKEVLPVFDPVTGAITNDVTSMIYGNNTTLDFSHWVAAQRQHLSGVLGLKHQYAWGDNAIRSNVLLQVEELTLNRQNNTYRHLLAAGVVRYSKAGKYFADATLSYNGTNVLPSGSRFGLFPAVSAAWNLSKEDWLNDVSFVNDLKLRASFGLTGNDQVRQNISTGNFIGASGYWFTNNNTSYGAETISRLASSPTFETSTKSNIGLDAIFFNRIKLTADAFYNKRDGILVEAAGTTAQLIGIYAPFLPRGVTSNKGFELGLNLINKTGDFKYNIGGQLSFARNKIINMEEAYQPEEYLKRTGQRINQAFGLQAIGFFNDATDIANNPTHTFSTVSPGDIKYQNQNQDNIIDRYDVVPLGYSTQNPEFYYSGMIELEYKGIGINALFQGIARQTLYLDVPTLYWPLRNNMSMTHFSDNSWTPETAATATLPRLSMTESANNYQRNSIWLVDGSYFKLRSAQLYYNLPANLTSKMALNKARIYVEGSNLFSIDNIQNADPEAIWTSYPTQMSIILGIQVNF